MEMEEAEQSADRSNRRNVTIGLRAPGDFTVDDSVPVQQDSFGADIPMFGGYRPIPSTASPPPAAAEPRMMRLESVQPVSVNLIGFSDRHRLSKGSIGDELATWQVRVVRAKWFDIAEWAAFLTVVGCGLAMLRGSRKCKARFVFLTVIVGTILVLIPNLELWSDVINAAVFAVLTVVLPIYLLIAFGGALHRWFARWFERLPLGKRAIAIAAIIVLALTCLFTLRAMAEEVQRSQETEVRSRESGEQEFQTDFGIYVKRVEIGRFRISVPSPFGGGLGWGWGDVPVV